MFMRQLYDEILAHASYLIGCQRTGEAIVIDPSRDIDQYERLAHANGLRVTAAVDTHIHADYLSGLQAYAEKDVHVYASAEGGKDWQYEWLKKTHPHTLLHDSDEFRVGNLRFQAIHTPGHTPEHLSYLLFDAGNTDPIALLSGDFVFVGDLGRPDLLETAAGVVGAREPSAKALYASVKRLHTLQPHVQLWPAHGAGSACGKSLGAIPSTTVGYEFLHNAALQHATNEQTFVDFILKGQPATPLYFARMKRDNRGGAKTWTYHPVPQQKTPVRGSIILDVRPEAERHERGLLGAIHAPLDAAFPSVAGSYLPENAHITLIAHPNQVEIATRVLARLGYDGVVGYLEPSTLPQLHEQQDVTFDAIPANAVVLDVRAEHEYATGHIPHAMNIPHTRVILEQSKLPKDKTIYVHCASGGRAKAAVSALRGHGFNAILVDDAFTRYTGPQSTGVAKP
jgi:hydroxyacylglutathione hydrolase